MCAGLERSLAANLLEACGHNLEMALNMHMENGEPEEPQPGPSHQQEEDDGVRAPIPQKQVLRYPTYKRWFKWGIKISADLNICISGFESCTVSLQPKSALSNFLFSFSIEFFFLVSLFFFLELTGSNY
jgi:hypothetical protein